ncbi:MAG: T9SS type A sorting domain-containing protein [Bacteroidia bacterium]
MKNFFTAVLLLPAAFAFSQVYKSPESVEYDYANQQWFIANHGSGTGGHTIVKAKCATCPLQSFASGLTTGPHGLEIVNDTLYACDGGKLRGYDINTAAPVFTITITGASFLNGITHDNSGNLFITDYTNNKIFRFNTSTRTFNAFVSTGLSSPNGIIYDQPAGRCVFVQWGGSVKAVQLSDSTVSTVLASSGLTSLDGIAKDGAGNWFISSWGLNGVTKFTSSFTSPVNVLTSQTSPADIFYTTTDTLAVPHSGSDNIVTYHYFGSATSVNNLSAGESDLIIKPNPLVISAELKYNLTEDSNVQITLFDMTGKLVKEIANGQQSKGQHLVVLDRSGISAGDYLLTVRYGEKSIAKQIVIAD